MPGRPSRRLASALLVVFCAWAGLRAQSPAAPAAPPLSKEDAIRFLTTAKIVSGKEIGKGLTRPVRVKLSDGTLTHDAAFSIVEEHQPIMRYASGRTEIDFVDSYRYTIAAYRVAELIGLDDMMPVTVEREWRHEKGALSWWVDDAQMDEGERLKKRITPPDPEAWNRQMYRMRVFTQLVADTDRNLGNVLIDKDWKLWMIDFTRAFRHTRELLQPGDLTHCDRGLLQRLRDLNKDQVKERTRSYLSGAEIDPLMVRRDLIVQLFEKLAAEKGEAQVFY